MVTTGLGLAMEVIKTGSKLTEEEATESEFAVVVIKTGSKLTRLI